MRRSNLVQDTKNQSGILIPHSLNFAIAMNGFIELGAEIIAYESLDEIYDEVTREDIVLDYIDQCNTIFKKFGKTPHVPDYPDCMKEFLGREIWTDTIDSISADESKWSAGWFIKPVKDKAFTGKVISSIKDLIGCGNYNENYEVLCCEPLDIKAEWRGFILYDELIDLRPYGLNLHKTTSSKPNWSYHYDTDIVNQMMERFKTWKDRPVACSMDICVTGDGRTLLVEFNDCYALGAYGFSPIYYAKLISARWAQILEREDEYHF